MNIPERIQRKRTKGWRSPAGTVCVSRPSRWGNPFQTYSSTIIPTIDLGAKVNLLDGRAVGFMHLEIQCGNLDECLAWYRIYAENSIRLYERNGQDWLAELREASWISCWCPLNRPCHGDILVELLHQKWRPRSRGSQ